MTNIVVNDPYAPGGLRVWDDYQFRRKGWKGGGGPSAERPGHLPGPGVNTPPVNVSVPIIYGFLIQGSVLTCDEGAWTGTLPITYTYQWYRRLLGTAPINVILPSISGVLGEGHELTCDEEDWTGLEPITYTYQWYRIGLAPVNTVPPAVDGIPLEGEGLTCENGTWFGTSPVTYSYQWHRVTGTVSVPGEGLLTDEGAVLTTDEGEELVP